MTKDVIYISIDISYDFNFQPHFDKQTALHIKQIFNFFHLN